MSEHTDYAALTAYAKVNLNLAICGRDERGYHQLLSLVGFTEFGDRLLIRPSSAPTSVELTGPYANALEKAGGDSLLKEASHLYKTSSGTVSGHHILLEKNMPLGGGLGGGSADAGAYLRYLCKSKQEAETIRAASLSLGADVPACFDSEMQIMSSAGEVAHYIQPQNPSPFIVLANPHCHADTKSVFAYYAAHQPLYQNLTGDEMKQCVKTGDWQDILAIGNDLTEAACQLYAPVADMITLMKEEGQNLGSAFLGAAMSGSGASGFALFSDSEAAARYQKKLADAGLWAAASRLRQAK